MGYENVIEDLKLKLEELVADHLDDFDDMASWVTTLAEVQARLQRRMTAAMIEEVRRCRREARRVEVTVRTPDGQHTVVRTPAEEIPPTVFDGVMHALQRAEDVGGPEGEEYQELMFQIEAEARKRREAHRSWWKPKAPHGSEG